MHIVRVNHKNGLYLEFLFMDPGRADACAKTCAEAKLRGNGHPARDAPCEVTDDVGRVTWLDGTQMQSVQLVNLEDEVRFNTRMSVIAKITAADWMKEAGVDRHPLFAVNGHAAGSPGEQASTAMPAIGAPAPPTFSS